ncbi:MAG: GspE/PulE family protein [Candidatus Paceibacterota bacterium]
MIINVEQLEKFVIDSGLISKTDFVIAKKESEEKKESIGKILISEGKINEDDFSRISAYILGIPFVDLSDKKLDINTLSLIPEPIARKHNLIAFKKTDSELEVAMLDTDDLSEIDFINKKTGLRILPRLTNVASIKSGILQYQKSLKADFGDIIKTESDSMPTHNGNGSDQSAEDLKKIAEDIPVVRIVDTLLKHAILQSASDIHIEPYENEVVIRYRVDGILHDAMILPKNAGSGITARIKVLSSLKLDEKRLPQDGRFKIDLGGEKVSFRVSMLPTYYGEKTVMRLLREGSSGFTLEGLGFYGDGLEKIHEAMRYTTGMFLTTGPTGSGKTTTLYTLLELLNTPNVNISTIEDPIEYQMQRINQTQVKPDIGFSFSTGLRSLVRQDPDIIMVGEIRDTETASLAINAALTGHLVLSTLHTNSAAGAIPRLIDMKCEPFLLVSTIKIVIGQRLVRRLEKPKDKYKLSTAELKNLISKINSARVLEVLKAEKIIKPETDWKDVEFWKQNPTKEYPDGYHSRIGIYEILRVTPTIREMIMKNSSSDEIDIQAKKEGMLSIVEDGIVKAVKGLTTIEEVLRVISE